MRTYTVRSVQIGDGMPKICVPIVNASAEAIIARAHGLDKEKIDVVEWRVDHYEGADDVASVLQVLHELRAALGDTVLLFTFRTKGEGGERWITPEDYEMLLLGAACSKDADLIDVEILAGDVSTRRIIDGIHGAGAGVLASSHDFTQTPDKKEMIRRLQKMQQMGADLLKLAVMPQNVGDVLTLLELTDEMRRLYAKRPLITISMGPLGVVSRMCGETFGSAMTFAAAGECSAPGQLQVDQMRQVLQILHDSIHKE